MNELSDSKLLSDYVEAGSDDAFAELVRRHIDLVYSAARRMAGEQLAQDVTQGAFTALAANAHQLRNRQALAGWLHRTAQNIAAQTVRTDVRRRAREQEASAMNQLNASETDNTWERIAPHFDAALRELSEPDRDALMLRYFENKSLRDLGAQLGISDDAAQKRVRRALDRMREFFAKRGIAVGAGSLAAVISTNAVQSAPAGLAGSIATNAALTAPAIAAVTTTQIIAMTTLQKTIVGATVAALTVTGLFEARQIARSRDEIATLRQQRDALAQQNGSLIRERDSAAKPAELASSIATPRLPAPATRAAPLPAPASAGLSSSNLMVRLLNGETPKLTAAQIETYLKENRRNAASLLAAFRATSDKAFLTEALQNFPNDPRVAFDAVLHSDSPDERRQRLDRFKRLAPDNALAGYLSALDYFRAGQNDEAVKELIAASGKSQFQDYSWDFVQNAEEAWRSAGYSEAETRMIATWQLVLPQASEVDQLHKSIMDLANAYRQANDPASAQVALDFNMRLGQQMSSSPHDPLLNQMIGFAIQREALAAMDPAAANGTRGADSLAQRIEQLSQQTAAIKTLVKQMDSLQQTMSPQDWITYNDRTKTFGEMNALQWLTAKYSAK